MKRRVCRLALLVALAPLVVLAAPPTGAWQVYTIANGLRELPSYHIAPDGTGGVWVGDILGGRTIPRLGGLVHIRADTSSQVYTDEPFRACPSVDALALAPDNTLWIRMGDYNYSGVGDYLGTCGQNYGVVDSSGRRSYAIGLIGTDGLAQLLPRAQQPTGATAGLIVDRFGRPWVGTQHGVAVRESDGSWRAVALWDAEHGGTSALRAFANGEMIAAGSAGGGVAMITLRAAAAAESVSVLPPPGGDAQLPVSDLADGPGGLTVVAGRQVYQLMADRAGWRTIAVPVPDNVRPEEPISGQHLANVAGKLWIGAPQYGLFRLDESGWAAIVPGETPLPNGVVNDLTADGDSTLLIATEQGVARLDTRGASPDPSAFQRVFEPLWQRTNLGLNGTWVWGPRAWADRYEPYKEGLGGSRFVRYFDKARMEVSDPQANPNSPWYVTNGLLVVEMVRGLAQFSADPALSDCPYFRSGSCPATSQVAGDLDQQANAIAPTYADFYSFQFGVESRTGARVDTALTREQPYDGLTLIAQPTLATAVTTLEAYDDTTRHNIPHVFWSYMRAQPTDWLFAFGHPITEAYWIRTRIGGVEQWVMVQLFERRTLTYTPANRPAWQVEMGNVGQHYYTWRYGFYENLPWTR